jgi:hypothetical protein
MPKIDQVKNKIMRMLSSKMSIRLDDDGDILIQHESAVCFVSVDEWGEQDGDGDDIIIQVRAPILWDVRRTPELYEWVATKGQQFIVGRVACNKDEDPALTNVWFEYSILGDNVDEPEIVMAVSAVITTANKLDDQLKPLFGGRKSIEN